MSSENNHQKRDAETNVALGAFIAMLSVAVLAGTYFARTSHAQIVNAIAGFVLLLVGIGFLVTGIRAYGKPESSGSDE